MDTNAGRRDPERAISRDADELEERLERLQSDIDDAQGEAAKRREDTDLEEERPLAPDEESEEG